MKILEINNIRKEFGSLVAVNDINLSVEPGQVDGLIGPNGAGKTTLLRMLATILPPTDGNARQLSALRMQLNAAQRNAMQCTAM